MYTCDTRSKATNSATSNTHKHVSLPGRVGRRAGHRIGRSASHGLAARDWRLRLWGGAGLPLEIVLTDVDDFFDVLRLRVATCRGMLSHHVMWLVDFELLEVLHLAFVIRILRAV